jgi:phosphoribosylformylglycinamidine synthase
MRNREVRFVLPRRAVDGGLDANRVHRAYDAGRRSPSRGASRRQLHRDEATLDRLEGEDRVALRYAAETNGSARGIAGIVNERGNVMGLMPHPERRVEAAHGGVDGRRLFEGLVEALG